MKKITYSEEARGSMKVGIDKLANTVKVTLGPREIGRASCRERV